jgi:2-methylcitrate synthase
MPISDQSEKQRVQSNNPNSMSVPGSTAISCLGDPPDRLLYRGYAITDLAENASFEEVSYLLLRGTLPTRTELELYLDRLQQFRTLPPTLTDLQLQIPRSGQQRDALNMLRIGVSWLGSIEPEGQVPADPSEFLDRAERLIALLPAIMLLCHLGRDAEALAQLASHEKTAAGLILRALRGEAPPLAVRRALDASLICYADLAFNASTYVVRICASTQADLHSCIAAGLAALSGPLHGGASAAVNSLLDQLPTVDAVRAELPAALARKERIMGFGHALYRQMDPRTPILREVARSLISNDQDRQAFEAALAIEQIMREHRRLSPNVDFYTAVCYRMLGIPADLFGPLFACARIAGWCAHVAEQRLENHLIHPPARYTGPLDLSFVPLASRTRGTPTLG